MFRNLVDVGRAGRSRDLQPPGASRREDGGAIDVVLRQRATHLRECDGRGGEQPRIRGARKTRISASEDLATGETPRDGSRCAAPSNWWAYSSTTESGSFGDTQHEAQHGGSPGGFRSGGRSRHVGSAAAAAPPDRRLHVLRRRVDAAIEGELACVISGAAGARGFEVHRSRCRRGGECCSSTSPRRSPLGLGRGYGRADTCVVRPTFVCSVEDDGGKSDVSAGRSPEEIR